MEKRGTKKEKNKPENRKKKKRRSRKKKEEKRKKKMKKIFKTASDGGIERELRAEKKGFAKIDIFLSEIQQGGLA